MSNALEQAKRAAKDVALTTSVRIDLDLLQALITEIERLQKLHGAQPEPSVIVMKHKDIKA